jgi:hypothetical protein
VIPDELTGDPLLRVYAGLIVELGKFLRDEGWQAAVDEFQSGPDSKKIAVEIIKNAMKGDVDNVVSLLSGKRGVMRGFGLEPDNWLREGLLRELLAPFQPASDSADDDADLGKPGEAERSEDSVPPGGWSKPKSPKELVRVFGVSWSTIKRRFKDGKIRHHRLSTKSYKVAVADLPANERTEQESAPK